jgi:hypothetical protein
LFGLALPFLQLAGQREVKPVSRRDGRGVSRAQVSTTPRPRAATSDHGDAFAALRPFPRNSEPLGSPDLDLGKERRIGGHEIDVVARAVL